MKLAFVLSALSALAAVSAAPQSNTQVSVETLNYKGFTPIIFPPDGGCIIVARTYKKDGKLRVYDSAPVCVAGVGPLHSINFIEVDQQLQGVNKDDITWAAYGWVFPTDITYFTDGIGCVWLDADLSKPCLAEHELKPAGMVYPNPMTVGWWQDVWVKDREITEKL